MQAGLIAHDLIGGSAWAYMKIKLIYWVRGKHHTLVSKATFFYSFFFTALPRDGMNIKWVVCFYWEQIVQPPRTSHYKLQLRDFFFLCSFIERQSCLRVCPLKAAQLWVIQVGYLLYQSLGCTLSDYDCCREPTVKHKLFLLHQEKKNDIRWLLGVYCVLPALLWWLCITRPVF